ncbi:unnamed protein product [Ostreobium quekettii]|uniref:Uncharacterized protein n=1 Tax=Ostreobium quekettii TaxID=121088 RepID=A0A8S1J6T1_9CHLO|nr:unnamed protein product [Ostreobium quekettii]
MGTKSGGCPWQPPEGFVDCWIWGKGVEGDHPNVSAVRCSSDRNTKGTSCIVVRRSGFWRHAGSRPGATAANKANLHVKGGQFGHKDPPVVLAEGCCAAERTASPGLCGTQRIL